MAQVGKLPIQFWRGLSTSLITELPFTGANYSNGIIEYFGKGKDTGGTWSNPDLSGAITLTLSSHQGGTNTKDRLVRTDALSSRTATQNLPNSYFRVEFPAQLDRVRIDSYMFRTSAFTNRHPITWQIRGSIDGVAWTVIDDRVNETALDGLTFTQVHFTATGPGAGQWWKFVEILQTGTNFGGFDYLELARFEFFGAFGIVPDEGEPIVETDKNRVRIGDGVVPGGHRIGLLPRAGQTTTNAATTLVGGVWTAVNGLTVTLPEAGTWAIQALVGYELQLTDPTPRAQDAEVYARFVNQTQSLQYAEQGYFSFTTDNEFAHDVGYFTQVSMFEPITGAAALDVIGIEVFRTTTPNWTLSTAGVESNITFIQCTTDL